MKCLAFDTSAGACVAAVLVDEVVAARRAEPMSRGHTEALIPMLQAVVAEAGVAFGALDLVGVTVGPGAFTGIRIGLAAARGLALAADIPVAGVTTLAALAMSAPERSAGDRHVLALIDTKRGDLYVQMFAPDGEEATAAAVAAVGEVAALLGGRPTLVVGDAPDEAVAPLLALPAVARSVTRTVDPGALARLAAGRWRAGTALTPDPLYLRPPEAKLPPRRGLRP